MEPIYTYIKGKGWQLTPPRIWTMRCGTQVIVEYRKPNIGEAYTWHYENAGWGDIEWKYWVSIQWFNHSEIYQGPADDPSPNQEVAWVTLTKVE